jgi:hypothetical protein
MSAKWKLAWPSTFRSFFWSWEAAFRLSAASIFREIADEDYRLDLLFHHVKPRCFAVIDLKAGPCKAEYAGKMTFYLAAFDGMLSDPGDTPLIGLILCKGKKQLVVECALRKMATPTGIAELQHLEKRPAELDGSLPTIEEIEAELGADESVEGRRAI